MTSKEKAAESQPIATTCLKVIQEAIQSKSMQVFSQDPVIAQREIIEYDSRMRVFPMEKFNGPCYITVVNYYLTDQDLKNHNAYGAFVLYIEEECAGKLLKSLGHKGFDEDDEETVLDICSEFCKLLASNYKNELKNLGYKDLVMSDPLKYHNVVPEGVEFNYSEYVKYELSFYLWKQKALVVDITLKFLT